MSRASSLVSCVAASLSALVIGAVYLAALDGSFGNGDEVIYAEHIRAMHRTGDYFTLRVQDQVVLQRPAVGVALYAAVARVVPGEAGMRLVPALLSVLAALGTGAIVWRRGGSLVAGAAAALLCAGLPTFFVYGRLVLSDPPFICACVGAMAATLAAQRDPRWFAWIGGALGLAFATKSLAAGPPALALLPGILVAARKFPRKELRPGITLLAFVALAAPFYVTGLVLHGRRFLDDHVGYNLLARARGLEGVGLRSPTAYLEHIWFADGPAVAIFLVLTLLVGAVLAVRRRDGLLGTAVATPVILVAALSLVGTRLPHYLLPVYPAVAVCAGMIVARSRPLSACATVLAAVLLWHTSGRAPFDQILAPEPAAITLGQAAAAATVPGEPLYSLDWYAPSLGYYSDRPWRLLTTMDSMMRIVGSIDFFRAGGTVQRVPPWPEGAFVVAGPAARLQAAGLRRVRLLGAEDGHELWRAEAP